MQRATTILVSSFVWVLFAFGAAAQTVWVQIEAQPTLAQAQERVRDYSRFLPDVNGFALPGGWYAIALGPYEPDTASQRLRQLRAGGDVPLDSFVALGTAFRQQFWPIGGAAAVVQPQPPAPETVTEEVPVAQAEPEQPVIEIYEPDETVQQARRSERALGVEGKKRLQEALKWAGVYGGAIDGLYGQATRSSMAAYQAEQDWPATGVLTAGQRAVLFADYNAVLEGLGLKIVEDVDAGISINMPTALVKFDRFEPPFVHYSTADATVPKVLLISQRGDQNAFLGLYDILQTLEVVPLDGPRNRTNSSFEINGSNETLTSFTFAERRRDQIKGFILVWPTGNTAQFDRLKAEMRASFRATEGVLDEDLSDPSAQAPDLLAGLDIRQPLMSRSGFFADARGTVVTTASAIQSCGRITLDDTYEASVSYSDAASGIAVLTPTTELAPASFANFQSETPRLASDVAVSGYSYDGLLGAPTVTFGILADIRDLSGNTKLDRLAMMALPGDAGGPVFDRGGAVLGMLLPRDDSTGRQLPQDVQFSVDASEIGAALTQAGSAPVQVARAQNIAAEDLRDQARGITVLVSCWE
ncbi:trypsin-like peptidase domain-containing protein [Algirhabdus cladophorae]|uniref:trypsin-like peptidase domain-containing protein n=1 Tax=Algirhabdus cladophorae TaxID=3377108 RepID=UPI003B849BAA